MRLMTINIQLTTTENELDVLFMITLSKSIIRIYIGYIQGNLKMLLHFGSLKYLIYAVN